MKLLTASKFLCGLVLLLALSSTVQGKNDKKLALDPLSKVVSFDEGEITENSEPKDRLIEAEGKILNVDRAEKLTILLETQDPANRKKWIPFVPDILYHPYPDLSGQYWWSFQHTFDADLDLWKGVEGGQFQIKITVKQTITKKNKKENKERKFQTAVTYVTIVVFNVNPKPYVSGPSDAPEGKRVEVIASWEDPAGDLDAPFTTAWYIGDKLKQTELFWKEDDLDAFYFTAKAGMGPIKFCVWDKDMYINPKSNDAPKDEDACIIHTFTVWRTPGPTAYPSLAPTLSPTLPPSPAPTVEVTPSPSPGPTPMPQESPTSQPSDRPSPMPQESPTSRPSDQPSPMPHESPTRQPSNRPSPMPHETPTSQPSDRPGPMPSPTDVPTPSPTDIPTRSPTDI